MNNYFKQLFNFDRYANEAILATMLDVASPEKAVQLMAHLLNAQQIWLKRCLALPPATSVLWPEGEVDDFAGIITTNCNDWLNYIFNVQPAGFEKGITYKNTRGDSFENKLSDIIMHLINHGTHHRAQIGQQLKLAGIDSLPNTDYIFYIRQING